MMIVVEITMRLVFLVKCGSPLPEDFVPYSFVSQKAYDTRTVICGHTLVESV